MHQCTRILAIVLPKVSEQCRIKDARKNLLPAFGQSITKAHFDIHRRPNIVIAYTVLVSPNCTHLVVFFCSSERGIRIAEDELPDISVHRCMKSFHLLPVTVLLVLRARYYQQIAPAHETLCCFVLYCNLRDSDMGKKLAFVRFGRSHTVAVFLRSTFVSLPRIGTPIRRLQ